MEPQETQQPAVDANVQHIPKLGETVVAPSFSAFKAEERFSFVRAYDVNATKTEGYRNAVIRYRNTDKKAIQLSPKMATIPQMVLSADYKLPGVAESVFVGVLEDEQDNIIRSLIDSGASTINWDSVSLDAVLASITAIRVSNRLSKEQIEAWGTKALSIACYARADEIAITKGYDEAGKAKQRAGTLSAYVGLASKLAAPVPNIGAEGCNALKAMMARANLDDDISRVLAKKIEAILNPKVLEGDDL